MHYSPLIKRLTGGALVLYALHFPPGLAVDSGEPRASKSTP